MQVDLNLPLGRLPFRTLVGDLLPSSSHDGHCWSLHDSSDDTEGLACVCQQGQGQQMLLSTFVTCWHL